MDAEQFRKLYQERDRTHEALEAHWSIVESTTLNLDGTYTKSGSQPITVQWLKEYRPLKEAADAAEKAMTDFLAGMSS